MFHLLSPVGNLHPMSIINVDYHCIVTMDLPRMLSLDNIFPVTGTN